MKSYFFCILVSSVISVICTSLASGGGLEKYVKYVCSLICVIAVVAPIVSVLGSDMETELDYSTESSDREAAYYISEKAEEEVDTYIADIVYEKFGITPVDVSIEIYSEDGGAVVGDITVTLKESDREFAEETNDFLLGTLGCPVEVVVSGE